MPSKPAHMRESIRTTRKLKGVALWAVLGVVLGAIFPLVTFGLDAGPLVNGVIVGLVVGTVGAFVELFVFQQRFRRLPFSFVLLLRVVFYLLLIGSTAIFVIAFYQSLDNGVSLSEAFNLSEVQTFLTGGEFYLIVLYTVVAGITINFIRQINRLLGQGVLLNYITGKYHRPVEEDRIFMFLDITSSTTIAERLGHTLYHQLLNDFFYDITLPIIESGGEIYQYVGDEVVVTWRSKKGLPEGRCISCFFDIRDTIAEQKQGYEDKYGVVLGFKAGFHFGPVITAEVGDIKKEIAFHGDVVNTASRIQAQCRIVGKDLLVSRDLLDRLPEMQGYDRESVGAILLRGKEKEVDLFSITQARL
jgi:adenylate cyclase